MQAPIDANLTATPHLGTEFTDHLTYFRELWTRAMQGFLRHAKPGNKLIFAPELLAGTPEYARKFPFATSPGIALPPPSFPSRVVSLL